MPTDGIFTVNWKSPMLLSDKHLRLADECARQAYHWIARSVAPAVGGFGLVPTTRGGGAGARFSHEHGADRLTVHLHALSAVAPDGTFLVFDEDADPVLHGTVSAQAHLERNPPRPVRLSVCAEPAAGEDGGSRVEVGEPDPQEDPPRRPLLADGLRLRVEAGAHSQRSMLKIAEYVWDGVEVTPSQDFLPAALTLVAWPELGRSAVTLRREIERHRDLLVQGADQRNQPEASLLADVVLPWLAALAAVEDGLPQQASDVHPYVLWETTKRSLRIARTMLSARPDALEHCLKTFVQPGKLTSGDPRYFEVLDAFLGQPYDHDDLGPLFARCLDLLRGMRECVEYLLGSAPVKEAPKADVNVYYYKDKTYRLAAYRARVFELSEAWHTCFMRELDIPNPKSILLVCDSSLLVQNPRPNAGLWMLDKYEKVVANMFRVDVDNQTDPSKVVAHFQEIGEPTITSVSLASRGLLDLSGLSAEPDEKLRIYYED
jgi:hypothetical protein